MKSHARSARQQRSASTVETISTLRACSLVAAEQRVKVDRIEQKLATLQQLIADANPQPRTSDSKKLDAICQHLGINPDQ